MKTQEDYATKVKSWYRKNRRLLYICCLVKVHGSDENKEDYFITGKLC